MFSRRRRLLTLIVLAAPAAGIFAAAHGQSPDSAAAVRPALTVTEARVRQPIPGQDKTVGYFTARNDGTAPIVLVGAQSPSLRSIEMHAILHDGDMVRMRRQQTVEIAPGETVRFQPGGLHLMIFGTAGLGETVDIELVTASGGRVPVTFRTFALGEQ